MFKEAGNEILVFCDYESKSLRVGTNSPLVPGFKGFFREIACFRNAEEWMASQFPQQVTEEQIEGMIFWFWIDMLNETDDTIRP